jgi:hypothetical protein
VNGQFQRLAEPSGTFLDDQVARVPDLGKREGITAGRMEKAVVPLTVRGTQNHPLDIPAGAQHLEVTPEQIGRSVGRPASVTVFVAPVVQALPISPVRRWAAAG